MPGYDVLFGWGAVIVAAFLAAYAVGYLLGRLK